MRETLAPAGETRPARGPREAAPPPGLAPRARSGAGRRARPVPLPAAPGWGGGGALPRRLPAGAALAGRRRSRGWAGGRRVLDPAPACSRQRRWAGPPDARPRGAPSPGPGRACGRGLRRLLERAPPVRSRQRVLWRSRCCRGRCKRLISSEALRAAN